MQRRFAQLWQLCVRHKMEIAAACGGALCHPTIWMLLETKHLLLLTMPQHSTAVQEEGQGGNVERGQ